MSVSSSIISRPSNTFQVPDRLRRLQDLAFNLRWSWDEPTQELFRVLCPETWQRTHNPVQVLLALRDYRPATENSDILKLYDQVVTAFDDYMSVAQGAWFEASAGASGPVAYFCAEYGLHESFPGYSGGLGILAGDHCKAASDMNLPFVAVGLFYRNGYFRQVIDPDGRQEHNYPEFLASDLPVHRVLDPKTKAELMIDVALESRVIHCAVWEARVGRISILLLDTNVPENQPEDREITRLLYVRGREMRLAQEIVLGVGGVRALSAIGIQPATWHLNEGHSAFMLVERLGRQMKEAGQSFEAAAKALESNSVFTIHTPVPAGNEVFGEDLVRRFAAPIFAEHKIDPKDVLSRGLGVTADSGAFDMTAFCLKLSAHCNGVSLLHGKTAHGTWKSVTGRDVRGVTNGVHMGTWLGQPLRRLLDAYGLALPTLDKMARSSTEVQNYISEKIKEIPDKELWAIHLEQKRNSTEFLRARIRNQDARNGFDPRAIASHAAALRDDILSIGFARRFATYKRASLLFSDPKRLATILTSKDKPIQLIFAGKAHPADKPGQALIQDIISKVAKHKMQDHIFFIEDYEMEVGRFLVQGVDVWLNNPRRPLEASGTSGMKAEANGIPNLSILDGWWDEGYTGTNGWAIGGRDMLENEAAQDKIDSQSLYELLEKEVSVSFYERSPDLPYSERWVKMMKDSIRTSLFTFSTTRMLSDYMAQMYRPAGLR